MGWNKVWSTLLWWNLDHTKLCHIRPVLLHYHLQVPANPKKIAQKTDAIFSIYGKNGIIPWHFFQILSWAFWGRWGRMTSDGEILMLRPRNFAIIPETLAPQLKKVRRFSKVKQIITLEPFVIQRSTLPFWVEEPKFQEWLQNFEVAASKFHHLGSFDLNDLKRPNWEFERNVMG